MAYLLTENLVVKPASCDEDVRLASDLMARVHQPEVATPLQWVQTSGANYPGFRREHTRIAFWNGEMAGALRVTTETIRLGEARLKMGGLGWVSTEPRHRRKGISTALIQDALHYMRMHRYHVSMLFGIPNFYQRFGYVPALADYDILLDPQVVDGIPASGFRQRPIKPGDLAAVQKIRDANSRNVSCSLLRSRAHYASKWERFKRTQVVTNREGRVLAYLLPHAGDDGLTIEEVGIESDVMAPEVLLAATRLAQETMKGRIRFLVPPEHPFAHYLAQFQSTHEMHLDTRGGGMMCLVDTAEALEMLIPEWEELLTGSNVEDRRCEVTFLVDRRPYRVRTNRGAIDIADVPGKNKLSLTSGELMQLITGYVYLNDILNRERRLLTPDARAFLAALFPKRNPYVAAFDRF